MAYVRAGEVVQNRSPWRLSSIPEFFWATVNLIGLFFTSLISTDASVKKTKGRGGGGRGRWDGHGGGGGGGGGGFGPGGGGGGGGGRRGPRAVAGMSNVSGLDHRASATGSS